MFIVLAKAHDNPWVYGFSRAIAPLSCRAVRSTLVWWYSSNA